MAEDAMAVPEPAEPKHGKKEQKFSPLASLLEKAQVQVATRHHEVLEAVVKEEADKKLAERKKLVQAAKEKWQEAKSAVQKIRPKPLSYNLDGRVQTEGYDKAQVDDLKKQNELIAKLEKALLEAVPELDPASYGRPATAPNWDGLQKLVGKDKGDGGKDKGDGGEK